MKITIKTLEHKVFQIDLEDSKTILDLKNKIHSEHGHPVPCQKIIYSGKVLADDKTIESCYIKERDFFVLMVSKPKPQPASTSAAAQPAPPAAAAHPQSQPGAGATAAPPAADPAPSATAPGSQVRTDPQQSFLTGEALQTTIQNMMEMGFPRDQVTRALRASFNNPDRAVEYLMMGIPAHLEAEASSVAPSAPPPQPPSVTQPQPENIFQLAQQQQQQSQRTQVPGALSALQSNSRMQQLRELIGENPAILPRLVQQLVETNPQLARLLAEEPERLGELFDPSEGSFGGGEQETVINVTQEERAAIGRLEDLGFPRHAVIEAYFACDKDEELAANYLFENQPASE